MDNPKTFVVDDILRGYNDSMKLHSIYDDLKKGPLSVSPIQESAKPLIFLGPPNWRYGNYGWELYDLNPTLLMLEYFGRWTGYAHERDVPLKPGEKAESGERAPLSELRLTIHNSKKELENSIEEIIAKYPRDPTPKTS